VTVFEKSDRIGGLLRYGIPEFKMEKRVLDRRLALMAAEGVAFRGGVDVGGPDMPARRLRAEFDTVLLAAGAGQPRDLPVPGRELKGVHFAMEYLTLQNRRCEGDDIPDDAFITAQGKHVIIIGGGDTGADCLGTAHRQGATSVTQLELLPQPPAERTPDNPWPQWPNVFRVSPAHEEGGERLYAVSTRKFTGDASGRVQTLHAVKVEMLRRDGRVQFEPVAGSEFEIAADLVLLAMGFVGPARGPLVDDLGLKLTDRGNVWRDDRWMTNVPGVFTAGDMQRGQSLIVWAIAEGRSAARGIDQFLTGDSKLPAPLA
jgi:glutamate synthase (NADPH/NADH) small chain